MTSRPLLRTTSACTTPLLPQQPPSLKSSGVDNVGQTTNCFQSSNLAEYAVVACLFAGLGGALWYGMSISSPKKAEEPAKVAAPAAEAKAVTVAAKPGEFTPPGVSDYPEGPMGEWVRRGEAIFTRTPVNAVGFSGNPLSCTNCHLDAGRLKGAAPMWGPTPCTRPIARRPTMWTLLPSACAAASCTP
jgi:hypothetical protein